MVNLVRSGRKQPQLFTAGAGGKARHPPHTPNVARESIQVASYVANSRLVQLVRIRTGLLIQSLRT